MGGGRYRNQQYCRATRLIEGGDLVHAGHEVGNGIRGRHRTEGADEGEFRLADAIDGLEQDQAILAVGAEAESTSAMSSKSLAGSMVMVSPTAHPTESVRAKG